MSKKLFALVSGIIGGVSAIATAVVSYVQPTFTPAIVGAIGIIATAIIEVCNLFVVKE